MFKNTILVSTLFVLSFNSFACSVQGEMVASRLFISSVLKKLVSEPSLKDYEVKTLVKTSSLNMYEVGLMNEVRYRCEKAIVEASVDSACNFDSRFVAIQSIPCGEL